MFSVVRVVRMVEVRVVRVVMSSEFFVVWRIFGLLVIIVYYFRLKFF